MNAQKSLTSYFSPMLWLVVLTLSSCTTETDSESETQKSIRVVFNMSPATVVYENNKKVPVFAVDPREDILGSIKKAGFKLITKEDKPYDLKLVVDYHERARSISRYPGEVRGATSVSISDFHFTLFDSNGQQLLYEKFDSSLRSPDQRGSNASAWFYNEIPQLILGRLEAEDELSFLISRVQAEGFIEILERPGGLNLLKRIESFQDPSAIDVILPFIRVGNQYARSRAKYTLYTLGYRPESIPEKSAWDIIDLDHLGGLTVKENDAIPWGIQTQVTGPRGTRMISNPLKVHHYLAYYGLAGIKLMLEDFKVKRRKLYLNSISDQARNGLWMLSKENWARAWGRGNVRLKYFDLDKITYLSKEEVYRILGSKAKGGRINRRHFSSLFLEEWNFHVTETLIADLNDTRSDEAYLKDAIAILGDIGDKTAVEALKPFLTDRSLVEEAKKAISKIESR